MRYFFKKLWIALIISTLISVTTYLILFLIKRKKQTKLGLKLKEKEDAENMFLSLACAEKPIDFFVNLASKKHNNIIKHKNYIIIKHQIIDKMNGENTEHESEHKDQIHNKKHKLKKLSNIKLISTRKDENRKNGNKEESRDNDNKDKENKQPKETSTLLYVDFSFDGLNIQRFMEIYNSIKKEKANKIVITCKEVTDKHLFAFCGNFQEKFLILDEYQTYQRLYKYYNCYPEITHKYKGEKRLAFKEFLAYSFNKKRTKGYLISSMILVMCSFFVSTTIYYCVVASILVVFALISQFNPYFNPKNNPEIL